MPKRKMTLLDYLEAKGSALGLSLNGTFELTPRCNFACRMCYVRLSAQEQRAVGKELTAAQWINLAEQAKKEGTVFILLTGGEPLLRADFPEIYSALKKMGFVLTVNTNGYLLNGALRELFLRDPPNRVNVTLYGTSNETYKKLCGVPAFDRIIENIQALRQGGISVGCNLTLTPDNASELPQLVKTAQALGVQTRAAAYMFPPRRRGEKFCSRDYRLDAHLAGSFQAIYEKLTMQPEAWKRRKTALLNGLTPEPLDDCDGATGLQMQCRAGKTCYWITWDGHMLPCGQMLEPSFPIRPEGFAEAWRKTREAAAEIHLPVQCAGCEKRHACHACAAMCYGETGAYNKKPEYLCALTDAYLEEVLKMEKTGHEDKA